ncbi:protein WHAT'S THIS FACTOR 9, mitochondrial-like isoform X1 [Apium graveolens]|uniref:protein WHAT'S THIS FACTOR 9, mitochondrial-like isoform X1 n=1 Tax=Apium graveolens TaxID=4045 RepID=UPI003D7B0714
MAQTTTSTANLRHILRRHYLYHHRRTFIDARIKWVRDPYLDHAVEKEKNLKQLLSLKNIILFHHSKTLAVAAVSGHLKLPTTPTKFIDKYPSVFNHFLSLKPFSHPQVRLTKHALSLHKLETLILNSPKGKIDSAQRLAKLLMLTKRKKLPLFVIDKLKFDLGLPYNYVLDLVPDFPDYFQICSIENFGFGLELVSWRKDLAFSVMEMRVGEKGRRPIRFSMNLPRGFDLQKKVRDWVFEWNNLPYISPYEDASYLGPNTDQAEKWTVAVLHELLHLCVSKKTEIDNVCCLGDYLGFGTRFKKALKHHPGIFYMSNKIRTQTVVLREVYRKAALVDVHPLMEMRYRYIDLMNKRVKKNPLQVRPDGRKNLSAFPAGEGRINDIVIREQNVETKLGSSESEVESSDFEV